MLIIFNNNYMIMKFITNRKLFLLVSLYILCFSFSIRLRSRQTGVEQQTLTINIYNNLSQLVTANDIIIKLIQNQQEINGVNKYVGYWETKIKEGYSNAVQFPFIEEIPNFGRLVDDTTVNIDFRYILGCNFDVREESNDIKVISEWISKESVSQHVYRIEMIMKGEGNKLEEIKKYFENISKICHSTQESSNILKGQLAAILKANLKLKKKKKGRIKTIKKIDQVPNANKDNKDEVKEGAKDTVSNKNKETHTKKGKKDNNSKHNKGSSTKENPPQKSDSTKDDPTKNVEDTTLHPVMKKDLAPTDPELPPQTTELTVHDIDDPKIQTELKDLEDTIKKEKENLEKEKENKTKLSKRANEIMDRLDKDNQQLSIIEPKHEEYKQNMKSADENISKAGKEIQVKNEKNKKIQTSLTEKKTTKTSQDEKVKKLTDNYNNIKADLNKNTEDQTNVNKKIAEVEAKITVETEGLTALETKKKQVLTKINDLTNEIKKDSDDVESNQKNLDLLQTSFKNLEEEKKKVDKEIQELKGKLDAVMKKENDIKKQIDPKELSTLESQQQTTLTQLSELEKKLSKKKEDLMAIVDPEDGKIVDKAYKEITNKENFDPESYMKILKTIPANVWQIPGSAAPTAF